MFSQYSNTIERLAEYNDLPLMPEPAEQILDLKKKHQDIFTSAFRYRTPSLPAGWVDASEEISCHLVVLKSLWPLVLPYYASALDFYARWSDWIAGYNEVCRPESHLIHQGNAHDLLTFVEAELKRFGLQTSDIAELVCYEKNKLNARDLRDPLGSTANGHTTHGKSILALRCQYIAQTLHYDLSVLLSGHRAEPLPPPGDAFAIFAKVSPGFVDTLQMGRAGRYLLELAAHPRYLDVLVKDLSKHTQISPEGGARLINDFHKRGLLTEIEAQHAVN